jgi:hypothetical protein
MPSLYRGREEITSPPNWGRLRGGTDNVKSGLHPTLALPSKGMEEITSPPNWGRLRGGTDNVVSGLHPTLTLPSMGRGKIGSK